MVKCLDSISNQTYKNIEIIIVNDGSTDQSGKICADYAERDERIKIIYKENGGLSSARNAGIEVASGKYITFIDSDDWVSINFVDVLYKYANEHNANIVQCTFSRETNEKQEGLQKEHYSHMVYHGKDALKGLYNNRDVNVMAWGKLYEISLFFKLRYPVGMIHEDEAVIHELLYNSNKTIIVNSVLYYYRIRKNSITQLNRTFNPRKMDAIKALEYRKAFFRSKNERELEQLTNRSYFRALLDVHSLLLFSNQDLNEKYLDLVRQKIKSEEDGLSYNAYFKRLDLILFKLYKFSPYLCALTVLGMQKTKEIKYGLKT